MSGADPGFFFRRGCTSLLLYFNTNKSHSFFLQNTSCIRKPQVISRRGGGDAHPLHPPPISAPACSSSRVCLPCFVQFRQKKLRAVNKLNLTLQPIEPQLCNSEFEEGFSVSYMYELSSSKSIITLYFNVRAGPTFYSITLLGHTVACCCEVF